mmetsp:Transcript_58962/g.156273  ORF Transcript_58962/g.156273 Transcript_58962/m.156273 type:complete len:478 (-) Transcript_58962:388-1821(-)
MQDETLHILVTRHPYEWIESMQRNGFYAPFHKGLPMKQFLALEWLSLDMSPSHLLMVENHLRTNPPQQTGAAPGRRFLLSPQASVQGTALDGVGSHAQPQPSPQQRTACSAQRQGQNRSTCWHQDAEFSCVPAPLATAAGAEDGNARPIQGCLPREISRRVCHPRALLCKRRHPFLTSLHVTFWERAAKAVAVTTGDEAADDFRELLASGTAAQDWEAAEQEDLRTASGCAAGAPSCFVPSIPADSSAFGDLVSKHRSQCCANNRTFSCVVAPEGFQVLEDPGWFPSKFCLDEATNLRKCGAGFLLCRTDSKERYPWIVDPVAWKHVSALLHRDPRKPDPANPRLSQWTKNNNMAGSNFRQLFPAARDTEISTLEMDVGRLLEHVKVKELLKDRDPDTGQRFPNVIALREAKLRDWLRVSQTLRYSHHVTCRDFMLDPRELLETLENKFMLIRKSHLGWETDLCVWRFGMCQKVIPS